MPVKIIFLVLLSFIRSINFSISDVNQDFNLVFNILIFDFSKMG